MSTVLKKQLAGMFAACALALAAGMFAAPAYADVSYVKAGDAYIYSDSEYRNVESVSGVSYDATTKTLTLENANISDDDYGIYISGATTDNVKVVLKGTNTITATGSYTYGIDSETALTLSGTNLTVKNCYYGIYGYSVAISNGTYNLTNCLSRGVYGRQFVKVNGGKLNITTDNPTSDYALYSPYGTISNSASNLGTIKGMLGEGATFKLSGSAYQVNSSGYKVTLKTYGGSKKKVTVNKATYGGYTYYVSAIGAKAFKNAKGKKVTNLTIGSRVDTIGKQAFYGMKNLKVLNMRNAYNAVSDPVKGKAPGIKTGAFKNCGKANGAKLTVKSGWSSDKYKSGFKKALVKKGLSKKAKVVY